MNINFLVKESTGPLSKYADVLSPEGLAEKTEGD